MAVIPAPPYNIIPDLLTSAKGTITSLLNDTIADVKQKATDVEYLIFLLPPITQITCDDPNIKKLKALISKLEISIQNLEGVLNGIPQIATFLETTAAGALALIPVVLALPSPPTFPAVGAQTIEQLASILEKTRDIAGVINLQLSGLDPVIKTIVKSISLSNQLLLKICGTEAVNLNDLIGNINSIGNTNDFINITIRESVTNADINRRFPSDFYKDVNVPDETINERIQTIREILLRGSSVLSDLRESPSKILSGNGAPVSGIGKSGDYYTDVTTNTVYGPKPTDNSWS
jgi:hypothetical protein